MDGLHWRDQDDLEWYAANDTMHSSFGAQLERLRDEVGRDQPDYGAPPKWCEIRGGPADRARRIATRLSLAQARDVIAPAVLLAVHHPSAVALDGIRTLVDGLPRQQYDRLDSGRLLAVYPMTTAAAVVRGREKPATQGEARVRSVLSLNGRTPTEALRALAHQKRRAKPDELDLWREIDSEARDLMQRAITAWVASPLAATTRTKFF